MKIRRFDRRTFIRKAVTNTAIGDRTHVTVQVVPLDTPAPNATSRTQDKDAQLQARGAHQPQDR
jgi:hypothetical protein